jgi:hypothetical protein
VLNVRRGVLNTYFVLTGSLRRESRRLLGYSSGTDALTLRRSDGVREVWWGCLSRNNPFDC